MCVSGDGGELFKQDVLTQCVQRDILPHIQTDGADLERERKKGKEEKRKRFIRLFVYTHIDKVTASFGDLSHSVIHSISRAVLHLFQSFAKNLKTSLFLSF